MLFKAALSVFAILAAAVSGETAEANGNKVEMRNFKAAIPEAIVPLPVGNSTGSWTNFQFTNVGFNVTNTFQVNNTGLASLQVTDLYYIGDSFAIFVNDAYIGSTFLVNPDMLTTTTNATLAYISNEWSAGCFVLPPVIGGNLNNITIGVNQSPFTAGAAAIRVVSGLAC